MPSQGRARIYIDADAKGVSRGTREAEQSISRLSSSGRSSLGSLKAAAVGAGLALGAAGLAREIQASIKAFRESEGSAARMSAQLQKLGANTDDARAKIDAVVQAASQHLAFDDEALQDAFTRIVRRSHDVGQALGPAGLGLAMDLARARQLDVVKAADIVGKVLGGNVGILNRYGVSVQKGATVTEALAAAQKAVGGQAEAFAQTNAAAADRASVAWENLQETFGGKVAPAAAIAGAALVSLAGSVGEATNAIGGLGPVLAGAGGTVGFLLLAPAIANVGAAISSMAIAARTAPTVGAFLADIGMMAGPVGLAAVGVGLLSGAIVYLATSESTIDGITRGAASAFNELGQSIDNARNAADAIAGSDLALKASQLAVEAATRNRASAVSDLRAANRHLEESSRGVAAADDKVKAARAGSDPAKTAAAERELAAARKANEQNTRAQAAAEERAKGAANALALAKLGEKQAQDADTRAKKNNADATDDARKHAQEFAKRIDELGASLHGAAGKSVEAVGSFGGISRSDAAKQAKITAAAFRALADDAGKMPKPVAAAARTIADLVAKQKLLPDQAIKELKVITNAAAAGRDISGLVDALNHVPPSWSKTYTTIEEHRIHITTTRTGQAGGARVGGPRGAGDSVPALVAPGEVILNPTQIDMAGRGAVMAALARTGAPTIGGLWHGYAAGGSSAEAIKAAKGKSSPGGTTITAGERKHIDALKLQEAHDRQRGAIQKRLDQDELQLAIAEGTQSSQDDLHALQNKLEDLQDMLGLRFLTVAERAGYVRDVNSTKAAMQALRDPQRPPLPGGGGGGGGTGGGGDGGGGGGEDADLRAQLDQANRKAEAYRLNLAASEAALSVFGGAGGLFQGGAGGSGEYAVVKMERVTGDAGAQSVLAGAAVGGMSQQGYIPSPRFSMGV